MHLVILAALTLAGGAVAHDRSRALTNTCWVDDDCTSRASKEQLAEWGLWGKRVFCDSRCIPGVNDPYDGKWCNWFELGIDCRACRDDCATIDCVPCPVISVPLPTPAPLPQPTPAPAPTPPKPIPPTPSPSTLVATPSPTSEASGTEPPAAIASPAPSVVPTASPTFSTASPTEASGTEPPSGAATASPTSAPTSAPTSTPVVTVAPTPAPTLLATLAPSEPACRPTGTKCFPDEAGGDLCCEPSICTSALEGSDFQCYCIPAGGACPEGAGGVAPQCCNGACVVADDESLVCPSA